MAFFVKVGQLRRLIREELGASESELVASSLDKDPAFIKRLLMDVGRSLRVAREDYHKFRDLVNQIATGATGQAAWTTTDADKSLGLTNVESNDPSFNQIKNLLIALPGQLPEPTTSAGVDITNVYTVLQKAKKMLEKYVVTIGSSVQKSKLAPKTNKHLPAAED